MSLFRDVDIQNFDTKIPEIVESAEAAKMEKLRPTKKDMWDIIFIVRDFVIEKKRKIYGGFALNKLIESIAPEDKFYDDENIKSWDIDFYSPDPIADAKEICDRLYAKKYKFISATEAQHEETYKVFAEVIEGGVADISYVPRNIYNKMPYKEINGLWLTGPHFMMIDYFRVMRDPLGSYFRLEKTVKRLSLMDKHFPLPHNSSPLDIIPAEGNLDIAFKTVHEFMTNRESIIVLGVYAYNHYVRESDIQNRKESDKDADSILGGNRSRKNKNANNRDNRDNRDNKKNKNGFTEIKMIPINYYEAVSMGYKKDASDLILKLREKFLDNGKLITYEESYPFFQYLGYSVTIKYEDEVICKLYHYNNNCIPYHVVPAYYFGDRKSSMLEGQTEKTGKITIGSFPMIMLYNLINVMKARVDDDQQTKNVYYILISHMIEMRNWYLDKTKKTIFDDTIFKDFVLECRGNMVTPQVEKQIRYEKRNKSGKKNVIFRYNPANEKDRESKMVFRFKNSSGNPINNASNRKIDLNLNKIYKEETDVEQEILESEDEKETDDTGSSELDSNEVGSSEVGSSEVDSSDLDSRDLE